MDNARHLSVLESDAGLRLDTWLFRQVRALSRVQIRQLIHGGQVRVAGRPAFARQPVRGGDRVAVVLPPPRPSALRPQFIPLVVLHEDADIVVIDKPPGLVMHPAAGHADGTLANALIQRCHDMIIGNVVRPGLVHRLDRDTSGVLVVAKNARALTILARQFKRRAVRKEYLALVRGAPKPEEGLIEAPIGRDPDDPRRMAVGGPGGRPAATRYRTLQAFARGALLGIILETGRTHQVRVHLAHIGCPVIGDRQYGPGSSAVARHMLHAHRIRIRHPATNDYREFTAPVPEDMIREISCLKSGGPGL